jgi:hypothetical protein
VRTLGFRRDLYSGFAVDAAAKAFAELAEIERAETPDRFELRITAKAGHDERLLADELANYALGATIERRGPDD